MREATRKRWVLAGKIRGLRKDEIEELSLKGKGLGKMNSGVAGLGQKRGFWSEKTMTWQTIKCARNFIVLVLIGPEVEELKKTRILRGKTSSSVGK